MPKWLLGQSPSVDYWIDLAASTKNFGTACIENEPSTYSMGSTEVCWVREVRWCPEEEGRKKGSFFSCFFSIAVPRDLYSPSFHVVWRNAVVNSSHRYYQFSCKTVICFRSFLHSQEIYILCLSTLYLGMLLWTVLMDTTRSVVKQISPTQNTIDWDKTKI